MMKNLLVYRIITYILLFVAAFFAVLVFSSLFAALANPAALLPLFLIVCIIIYSYCSWKFLVRGIDKKMTFKPSFRDLIKVNGYVSLVLGGLILFQMIVILTQPQLINDLIVQVKAAQPEGAAMTEEMLIKATRFVLRFLMTYSTLLVIHTVLTLRILKQYPEVFEEPVDM